MASACLSDVHNYTTSVCSFPQWQATQGFSGYAGRKRCSGGSSFNIHFNTLFIKQADQSYPFTPYTSCNALPLLWFLLGLRDARVVLYQEYLAIISLSPTGQFSDLRTACSLHLYPVYVDSCMHYEVVVGVRCVRYSNFAWGITALVHVNQVNGNVKKNVWVFSSFFFLFFLGELFFVHIKITFPSIRKLHIQEHINVAFTDWWFIWFSAAAECYCVRGNSVRNGNTCSIVTVCKCRRLLVLIVQSHQQSPYCFKSPSIFHQCVAVLK